jgi:hypothetical protein
MSVEQQVRRFDVPVERSEFVSVAIRVMQMGGNPGFSFKAFQVLLVEQGPAGAAP